MIRRSLPRLWVFKLLLRLYPKEYRDEYGSEMIYLALEMLQKARSKSRQIKVIIKLISDFALSVIKQNVIVYKDWLNERPSYLKHSSLFANALVFPYVFVCSDNLVAHRILHRKTLLMEWEARTWIIYCIFLPIVALLIVAFAASFRIYKGARSSDDSPYHSGFSQDALILGLPLTLLTTVVLL